MIRTEWPPSEMPGGDEYLIALGAFVLHYNEAEMALWTFFQLFIDKSEARDFLFDNLHNRERVDLIKIFAQDASPEAFRDAIIYGLSCFDRLCENRNILLHGFADHPAADEPLDVRLLKRRANSPGTLNVYVAPRDTVRANAVFAENVKWYLFGLSHYADEKSKVTWPISAGSTIPELPPRPPRQDKLSLYKPPKAPEPETRPA